MNRTQLLGAASAAALACLSTASYAQTPTVVQGGGSTLAYYDYTSEFAAFNSTVTASEYSFGTYLPGVGSGTGQKGFLTNDYTCDQNKSSGANGGACVGVPGGAATVHYGASDAVLSGSQISSWSTSSVGQSAAGNLIQLPTIGVGIAIVINNKSATTNGKVHLSSHDVCGVFSGAITNFSQITDAGTLTAGEISVAYRSDGSGTTFLLTNHLNAACTSADVPTGFTFTATTTFASLFTSGLPSNFIVSNGTNLNGGQGVANTLSNCPGAATTYSSAIGYLSPDFTSVTAKTSSAQVCGTVVGGVETGGVKSKLIVAAVTGTDGVNYLPTGILVEKGLKNPTAGKGTTNTVPPANATDGANPALWVPTVGLVSTGYPIVGYTTMDFAQCYEDPKVANSIVAFLKAHYNTAAFKTIQSANGFVALTNTPGAKFEATILTRIVGNITSGGVWNDNIQNPTACSTHAGR